MGSHNFINSNLIYQDVVGKSFPFSLGIMLRGGKKKAYERESCLLAKHGSLMGNIRWLLDDPRALFRMPLRASISFIHKANLLLSSHLPSQFFSPVLLDCNTSEFLDMKWGCSFSPASQSLKITENVAYEFLNFGIFLFCPIKNDLSGKTFWPQA